MDIVPGINTKAFHQSYVGIAEKTYTVEKHADWRNHRSKF